MTSPTKAGVDEQTYSHNQTLTFDLGISPSLLSTRSCKRIQLRVPAGYTTVSVVDTYDYR